MSKPTTNFPEDLSDADLLKRVHAGEREAAGEIYSRYAERLMQLTAKQSSSKLAGRVEADDIVQSVFRTFFRRASGGYYRLPDGDELWKLFLVISLNKIRKKSIFLHADKRDISKTEQLSDQPMEAAKTSEDILRLTIDELIDELPAEQRGAIRDRIGGFEIAEISERNEISKRTTERILQNFRTRLQRELEAK